MSENYVSLSIVPASDFHLDGGAMFGIVPKPLWTKTHSADALNRIRLTTTSLLWRQRERCVLVDPGIGSAWDETFLDRYGVAVKDSEFSQALEWEGLSYDTITDVFLTHLHFDHVGGCFYLDEGGELRLRFPNAVHHVSRRQWKWANEPSAKDQGSYIKEHLELLASSQCMQFHEGEWSLMSGFDVFEVDGHTRGQQLCRIRMGGRTWVYGGDLFALADHLRIPWVMGYDIEPLKTLTAKETVLEEHLSAGEWLILGHDVNVVAGQVSRAGRYPELVHRITPTACSQLLESGVIEDDI
ncbi:MAG: MBL fold metallo-hydrolase [Verrucomicrobiota bacterium JB024]|nr:MBL fold metallo-hydrolase [Verrucomicrobiota bacterium JB024]